MKYDTVENIQFEGYKGFVKISNLFSDIKVAPDERGTYLVLYLNQEEPTFLEKGVGGYFKGKNPNVSIEDLNENWISDVIVVNIGQAGGIRAGKWSNSTLRERLKKYMKFGQGKNIGHYGGRYIWQIKQYEDLVICWSELPNKIKDPKVVESEMIAEFKSIYGRRPFANLQD